MSASKPPSSLLDNIDDLIANGNMHKEHTRLLEIRARHVRMSKTYEGLDVGRKRASESLYYI